MVGGSVSRVSKMILSTSGNKQGVGQQLALAGVGGN